MTPRVDVSLSPNTINHRTCYGGLFGIIAGYFSLVLYKNNAVYTH